MTKKQQNEQSLTRFSTDTAPDDSLYYFDEQEADRWCKWVEEHCTHTHGDLTGEYIHLEPFWRRIVRDVFGWMRREDGRRKHIYGDIFVPRKQHKSGILGGLDLGVMAIDHPKARKQGLILASTEDQAWKCYDMMRKQIDQDKLLKEIFSHDQECITHRPSGSTYMPNTSSKRGKTGTIPHLIRWEEWQEIVSDELVGAVETGIVSASEPIVWRIGTGGENPSPVLPNYREWLLAREILDGKRNLPSHYVVMSEAPDDCDPGDKKIWAAVNPMYGVSVNERILAETFEKAKQDAVLLAKFRQYHLNQWVKNSSPLGLEKLYRALQIGETLEEKLAFEKALEGLPCFAGLDMGGEEDMTALTLLFPFWRHEKNEKGEYEPFCDYKKLIWYWVPEFNNRQDENYRSNVKVWEKGGVPYRKWAEQGDLSITDGNTVDHTLIYESILNLKRRFKFEMLGYDPKNAHMLAQMLEKKGLKCVNIAQRHHVLNEPTKKFKELVHSGGISHNGNEVFYWNLRCARTDMDKDENIMIRSAISRGEDGLGKVDGISSTINALRLAINEPAPPKKKTFWVIGAD